VLRIGIVVGEVSGDKLAAGLIRELQTKYPNLTIEGVVGPELIRVGATELFSMERLAVMGLIEPLFRLRELIKIRTWLKKYFLHNPPDLFIGVDAPDFNLGLEVALKAAGIPVVHYVSPSVWAWRSGRIRKIKQAVDLMLTLLPFETKIYTEHNIPVKFVGHYAADNIPMVTDQTQAKQQLGLDLLEEKPVLLVLPGSRNSELKHMLPVYLKTLENCFKQNNNLQILVALVSNKHRDIFLQISYKLKVDLPINFVIGNSFLAMAACDLALVTSGTATLEVMLHKKPMIIAYKTNFITYQIGKKIVKVPFIGLPNLLANSRVAPEYIQTAANATNLSQAIMNLLTSNTERDLQINTYKSLHVVLQQDANKTAARIVMELLGI
jgi:lipid-A-disaccharide synthase